MVGQIAGAIREGFKLLSQWRKTRAIRRMKIAIDEAEKYILISECFGKYKSMTAEKRQAYKRVARAKFFKYNQG